VLARRFHPDAFESVWLDTVRALTRRLMLDSVAVMREIVAFVREDRSDATRSAPALVSTILSRVQRVDAAIQEEAANLESVVQRSVGGTAQGWPEDSSKRGGDVEARVCG
jgi:hypothetical protein